MKRLLYPLLVLPTIVLMSFTIKNDKKITKNNNTDNPIEGTWNFYLENGKEVSDCDAKSSITFEEDGTFFNEKYFHTKSNGKCTFVKVYDTNSTWSSLKNNSYRLIDPEHNPNEYEDYKVSFSENNQKMSMTLNYTADENGDGIKENHTEVLVLKKIKKDNLNEAIIASKE